MTIRTEEELSDRLAQDLVWRKKELTVLKKLLGSASQDRKTALLRSLVTLLYAHWEGFIRNANLSYVQYLALRRLRYSELASNFVALSLLSRIRDAVSRRDLTELIRLVELLRGDSDERAKILADTGDSGSNISSTVLRELIISIGLDYAPFESKAMIIDERLLRNRNRIAHGEYLSLDAPDTVALAGQVVALMENFRDQIENAVALSTYRRVTHTV